MPRIVGTLAALALAGTVGAAESPIRSIDIAQDSDRYIANVVMFAPVPINVAWDVLVDFDHMARWVPNVRESKATATEGNTVTVEQRGVAKFGIASFPYVSVRQMQLDPQKTVRATQVKGSMRSLESLMTVAADGGGTRLTYHLEMVPSGLAATVLSKEFLQHELTEQFTAIVEEMVRRNR
jgi:carbon monoxide dehydrogenase subunit G